MAKTIWKFPLKVTGEQEVVMPWASHILHVAEQAGTVCLWAEVDSEARQSPVTIRIFGTGHPMPDHPGTHIGTFLLQGGAFVFHAYLDQ